MDDNVTCEILNYNDAATVINMVAKIKDYQALSYILIVDNGSTDDSLEILSQKYAVDSKILVVGSGKNGGYGYGNNFGIEYAAKKLHSKYVIVSNPDVFFEEKLIKIMKTTLKECKAALVSGTQKINGNIVNRRAWKVPRPLEWACLETKIGQHLGGHFYYPASYYKGDISQVECVLGAMFMIDVDKFLEVGGYDEDMFLFCEETTLGFKLKEKGYKSYIINGYYYDHLHSTTINKNIPSVIKKLKILYSSEILFDKRYQNMTLLEEIGVKMIFKLSILKNKIKERLE
ncbi:glycosyltransferase [Lactobacillus helveticus]|uniref:Glycosyltransferase n=1 Tax=Lactobacillus helveticus TaxID=1587 RepID=A0A6A7K1Z5_LACHE|nr:glycosyltransferase [Lactobacillus helveticus]MPW14602.1 glycosyltransferase [Lactobacillus helveticus]